MYQSKGEPEVAFGRHDCSVRGQKIKKKLQINILRSYLLFP